MKTNILANPKRDFSSGIVVFLVALPLCLGIALASGAPLISGLIAGVIGGLVIGILSGSHTSVSGPAAGMAAVVLAAITKLGSFETFLMALVLAGVLQIIAGYSRLGIIASYIPTNIIKGLLAAVGIILILKQIPHALGFDAGAEGDFSFFQNDGENTFSELLKAADFFNPGAIVISGLSILILIYWEKSPIKKLQSFPPSLLIVLIGILLNNLFEKYFIELSLEATHLVTIPKITDISAILTMPNFGALNNHNVWMAALTIAIVASLETLVNLEATDNLDPMKRVSSPNRELVAQGVGNILAGLIGGIPTTSVVVRSSVNINAGSISKLSTILHGFFLLISVVLFSQYMNMIPLASLAAILLVAGYKLAKITIFKQMFAKGWNQFLPFLGTILAIVFTDLLTGIIIGSAISIFYLLKSNFENPFTLEEEKMAIGDTIHIKFSNQVTFLNKASVKKMLWTIPPYEKVIIDATNSNFIDHDVVENIHDFVNTIAKRRNIQVNILGMPGSNQIEDLIEFSNVIDKEVQQKLTPAEILELLKMGSERFMTGKRTEKYLNHQVHATSKSQSPMAVIVSCIDSRTSPELIFDAGIGDLISIRIAGNIMSEEILGSIELACSEIGTKLVVVLGHSNCGAVGAAIQSLVSGNISSITRKIEKSILKVGYDRNKISADLSLVNMVTMNNIKNTIEEIKSDSQYLKEKLDAAEIGIVAAFYDTSQGTVIFDELH